MERINPHSVSPHREPTAYTLYTGSMGAGSKKTCVSIHCSTTSKEVLDTRFQTFYC